MVKGMIARIEGINDAAQIQQLLGRLDAMGGQLPPEMKPALDYVRGKAQARLAQIQGAK
jgi:hypothetical protein